MKITLNGMNNRAKPEALPTPTPEFPYHRARNAVNVLFDDVGNTRMPRPGRTLRYAGDCHSLYATNDVTLFVEGENLKRLNDDDTTEILLSGVGDHPISYCTVGDTVYFACNAATGKFKDGAAIEWGTHVPPRQPDVIASKFGGLHAGTYRVAITWIGDEESGTRNSAKVTIAEGEGVYLYNFPTPPAYVSAIGVYVSSVNSKELYLYGEFRPGLDELTINRRICSIPLDTQFMFPPSPISGPMVAHYGRIYYAIDAVLFWTEAFRYGLQKAGNNWLFDSPIQTIVSCPNTLYVGTEKTLSKITLIDNDQPPDIEVLQNCKTVKGSECHNPDGEFAYIMSDRGFLQLSPDKVVEISYTQCAIPFFKRGAMTVTEYNGLNYLVFTGQDGTQNPLADAAYNAAELARNSL